jgi:hypothetical protein
MKQSLIIAVFLLVLTLLFSSRVLADPPFNPDDIIDPGGYNSPDGGGDPGDTGDPGEPPDDDPWNPGSKLVPPYQDPWGFFGERTDWRWGTRAIFLRIWHWSCLIRGW